MNSPILCVLCHYIEIIPRLIDGYSEMKWLVTAGNHRSPKTQENYFSSSPYFQPRISMNQGLPMTSSPCFPRRKRPERSPLPMKRMAHRSPKSQSERFGIHLHDIILWIPTATLLRLHLGMGCAWIILWMEILHQ